MLVRNRPTPGTPMAKSASFFSANSFTCRGVMICSARCLSSSGRTGSIGRASRSPLTRTVGGRPTFRCRSDPPRCTIWEMACLKLNGAAAAGASSPGKSAMGIHPEEDLAKLDRLGILDTDFPDDPAELRFDLIHDFHRFDDADRLPRRHPGACLEIGLRARLRRSVERSEERRLDFLERGHPGARAPGPATGVRPGGGKRRGGR